MIEQVVTPSSLQMLRERGHLVVVRVVQDLEEIG